LGILFFFAFLFSPNLHITLPPNYPTNPVILFTYILSLSTNYNKPPYPLTIYPFKAKFLPFGETSISFWLNLYHSGKKIPPWLNLYLLVKPSYSMVKPLFIDKKNYSLLGENLLKCTTHDKKGVVLIVVIFYLIF
jgi:hypothetical protein